MKLKKLTAVLLSAASLVSMPFTPALQDIWQDAAVTAEAAPYYNYYYYTTGNITYQFDQTNRTAYVYSVNNNATYVTIPLEVKYASSVFPVVGIREYAFQGCSNLTTVDLAPAKKLTYIGKYAFSGSSVRYVYIGSNATVDTGAFSYTSSLVSLTVEGGGENVTFRTKVFEQSQIQRLNCYGKKIRFEDQAFYMSINMTSLYFASNVSDIYIGSSVFHKMDKLTNVTFSNKNAKLSLGSYAFCNSGLTSLSLPNTVTTIPDSCFCGCNFSSLTLPASVKTIEQYAFSSAVLPETVTIGKNVTSIHETAFGNASGVKQFSVASDNPKYKSDVGVLYSKDGKTLLNYPQAKTGSGYATSATTIPDCAIANNKNLKTLTIRNYVRRNNSTVRDTAYFPGLDNLEYLNINNSEYNNSNGKTLLSNYGELFSGTKLHVINGNEIVVPAQNGNEPTFNSKFKSLMESSFEIYSNVSFMKRYLDTMADYVVKKVTTTSMSQIQKAMHLRKWIIDRADYDPDVIRYLNMKENGLNPSESLNSRKNHVPASVFLHKKSDGKYYTVCEGYAMCYELLLNKANINAVTVGGDNIESDKRGGHAWNLIQIGGKWYHADITWDDDDYKDASLFHRFDNFLCSDAQFHSDSHKVYDYHGYNDYSISKTRTTMLANVDNRKLGDLTGDGKYTSADVTKLQSYVGKSVSNAILGKGDMNLDGRITAADVTMLQSYVNNDWIYYATPRIYALFKAEQ